MAINFWIILYNMVYVPSNEIVDRMNCDRRLMYSWNSWVIFYYLEKVVGDCSDCMWWRGCCRVVVWLVLGGYLRGGECLMDMKWIQLLQQSLFSVDHARQTLDDGYYRRCVYCCTMKCYWRRPTDRSSWVNNNFIWKIWTLSDGV